MRGKVQSVAVIRLCAGITPAYAGKSVLFAHPVEVLKDHPRVCGEKLFDLTAKVTDKGSPPRMRGKG